MIIWEICQGGYVGLVRFLRLTLFATACQRSWEAKGEGAKLTQHLFSLEEGLWVPILKISWDNEIQSFISDGDFGSSNF